MQAPRQTVEPFKLLRLPRRFPVDGTKPLNFRSIERILAATALACAFVCEASAGLAETGAIMIAIDKMRPGAAPTDFEFARTGRGGPAQWTVTSDTSAVPGLPPEPANPDPNHHPSPLAISPPRFRPTRDVPPRYHTPAPESH